MLKIIFRLMLAIGLILLAGCAPKLAPFTPADKSFTIKMPGTPNSTQIPPNKDNHLAGGQAFESIFNGDTYLVGYYDLDFKATNIPEDMLGRLAFLFKKDGELISTIDVTINGNAGRELHIKTPDGKIEYIQYFTTQTRFYMLEVIMTKENKESTKTADTFLVSFKLENAS